MTTRGARVDGSMAGCSVPYNTCRGELCCQENLLFSWVAYLCEEIGYYMELVTVTSGQSNLT